MRTRAARILTVALLTLLAACQPAPEPPRLQITPFPTITPGRVVSGELLPPDVLTGGQISPATAVAIAALPTATPDLVTCPPRNDDVLLERTPPQNPQITIEEIMRFLQRGGPFSTLAATLRDDWGVIGEAGIARDDIDLTGSGRGEIILSYSAPGGGGQLLVIGCRAGAYEIFHEAEANIPAPPTLLSVGDMNRDRRNNLLFSFQRCEPDANGQPILNRCEYVTRLLSWSPALGRFVNLLRDDLVTYDLPEALDVDQDEVAEVVVRLENRGTAATGPLRTGLQVYDWNGEFYVLSIVQYDPPRFKIQVIHEADRALARREYGTAIALYNVALQDASLRFWFDDEVDALRSYTLYRLMLAQAASRNPALNDTYNTLAAAYPDPSTAPVYAALGQTFILTYQLTSEMSAGCREVIAAANRQPSALTLLNRYGSRSPTYTVQDLCPF